MDPAVLICTAALQQNPSTIKVLSLYLIRKLIKYFVLYLFRGESQILWEEPNSTKLEPSRLTMTQNLPKHNTFLSCHIIEN